MFPLSIGKDPILTYHFPKHCKHEKIKVIYCHRCWWKIFVDVRSNLNACIAKRCSCGSGYDEEIVYICESEQEIFYPCSYCDLLQSTTHTYHSQHIDDIVFKFSPFVSCPKRLFFTNMNKMNATICRRCKRIRGTINHGCEWMCEKCTNQTLYFEAPHDSTSSSPPSLVPFTIRKLPSLSLTN